MILLLFRMGNGEAVAQPVIASTKGGYVPPTYVRSKDRKKALSDIREDLNREIAALYEEAKEDSPKVIERAKRTEEKVESLFDWAESQRQTQAIKAFQVELDKAKRQVLEIQRDIEEAHIALLLLVA